MENLSNVWFDFELNHNSIGTWFDKSKKIKILIFCFLIADADQPGPFSTVEYSVADGPFSDYVAFENPLEGNLVLTKSLDYETMRSFSLTIEAKDQG